MLGGAWSELGPKPIAAPSTPEGEVAGRVTALAVDPTNAAVVYAGTADGGVWKTTNATGSTPSWTPLTDSQVTLAIGALAVDPNNPSTIYAGTGEPNKCQDCLPSQGVLKSVDGGAHWTLLAGSPQHRTSAVVVDRSNSNRVLVATTRGLYFSADGGVSWSQNTQIDSVTAAISSTTPVTGGINSLLQDPVNPSVFWAAMADWCNSEGGSIVVSRDSGTTWAESTHFPTLPNATRLALALGKDATNHVVAYVALAACPGGTYVDGQLLGIGKNPDAGGAGQWTVIQPGPNLPDFFAETPPDTLHQGWYDSMVAVDPSDPNRALFGGVTLLSTKDGGATFADIARPYSTNASSPPLLHPDFHAAAFTGPNTFYVANDGGVWHSTDLGGSYANLNHTLAITQLYAGASPNTGYLLGGSQDNGTLGIVPGGPAPPAWKQLLDGDGGWTAIDPSSGSKVVWSEQTHLDMWKGTYDTAGSTWKEMGPCGATGCPEATDFIAPFLMDPNTAARLYAGSTYVYRTVDGGSNWSKASGDLTFGHTFADPDVLHTMALAAGPTSTAVFASSWYGKVSKNAAADATSTWTDITGNLPPYSASADTGNPWITGLAVNPTNPSEAWATIGVASGARIWHTTNAGAAGGTVWTDITGVATAAVPSVVVDSVTVDPKNPQTIYIGTDAGALVCGTCGGLTALGSWSPLGTGLPNVRVDAITLTSDDATLVAWSHGRGVWSLTSGPKASLNPTSLDFGNQQTGTTGAAKPVTLTNNGTQPLLITTIATSGDFHQTNSCGSALLPGTSCTINVVFSPTATGSRTGTLSVGDNAGDSPQTAALTGTGTPPPNAYGSLAPASADFGNQEVGTTSPAKTFTLTNSGGMPLTITSITATPDFHETDSCPRSPSSLAPGAGCSIDVSFAPSARGAQSGTLSISDNATNTPQSASLSGTGVQAGASLSPASLAFGNQHVGTTSPGQNATLSNSGNEPLGISSISTSGDFNQTNNCGSSLAAGSSCTITVTFSPSAPGSRSGTLSVSDSASGSPQTTSLSGTGTQAGAALNPSSLTFGSEELNTTSAYQSVTLTNTGNETMAISGISTSGDFAQANDCGSALAPGAHCTIHVTFTPTTAGARTGTLTVSDNAPGSPHSIPLSGTGVISFYFAEGFTAGGFQEDLSLLAPNHDATATIEYYTPSSHTSVTRRLIAGHVASESVNTDVGANQQVSVKVTLDAMGVVERTMHFQFGAWRGSTDIVGVTHGSSEWNFAEGSTLGFFSEYLTLQNPNNAPVLVDLHYFTNTNVSSLKTVALPPTSRTTIPVFVGSAAPNSACDPNASCGIGPGYAGVSVQAIAQNAKPIVAERPFYVNGFSFGSGAIRDGHVAFGANAPAMQWNFAEGTTLPGFNEYLTLQNANPTASTVDLHYYNQLGAQATKTVALPPNARTTIEVFRGTFTDGSCAVVNGAGVGCGVGPGIDGVAVQVTVHPGSPPIVVERPLYMVRDFGTGPVAGAEVVVGATTLAQQFGFAWASTQPGDNDYLTIENPGTMPATITISYYGPVGPIGPAITVSMGAHLRKTVSLSDPAALGGAGPGRPQIGIIVSATQPVLVEKPTYSSNPATYGATDTAGYSPNSF